MADTLTKVTETVLDGSLTPGSGEVNKNAETAARIAGSPQAWRIYGTNASRTQGWLVPGDSSFPKVFSASNADKIAGTPTANSVWSTDDNGVQSWQSIPTGDMNTKIYDPSNTGKVNASVTADQLSGTPLANQIWGTNNVGRQVWLTLPVDQVMLKSEYASIDPNSSLVDTARYAEQIRSGQAAPSNSVYTKNAEDNFEWRLIDDLIPTDLMKKSVYDKSGSGKVDNAEVADSLASATSASNSTFYGKAADGSVGFKEISQISPQVMLKSDYDPANTGKLTASLLEASEEVQLGSVWTKTEEGQNWQLPHKPALSVVTGGNGSIILPDEETWTILYTVNGEAKVQVVTGETEFTWESEENSPAWAFKIK